MTGGRLLIIKQLIGLKPQIFCLTVTVMPKLWAADAVADAAFHGAHAEGRLARRALWSLGWCGRV